MNEREREFDIDHLLHPGKSFQSPQQVAADPKLTTNEKRAILASWASDACAVEAAPELRHPEHGPVVRYDDIMDALRKLDGEAARSVNYGTLMSRAERLKKLYEPARSGRTPFSLVHNVS